MSAAPIASGGSMSKPIRFSNPSAEPAQVNPVKKRKASVLLDTSEKCKSRLFIGEGVFSYTEALLAKHERNHPSLARSITATELKNQNMMDSEVQQRISRLKDKGVKIYFGIDGQKIDQIFKGQIFQRIHWNGPFGDPRAREAFRSVVPNFFLACAALQQPGDRIHIVLNQENQQFSRPNPSDHWKKRQTENPIVKGATLAGYRLIKKRKFGKDRYPGYELVQTDGKKYPYKERLREFIFEKTDLASKAIKDPLQRAYELQNSASKKYKIEAVRNYSLSARDLSDHCIDCSTDEDSSDYDSSTCTPKTSS